MNHLTEPQLNEYLDGELDAPGRAAVDSHLAACRGCRLALSDLQAVASLLADLPDEPLRRDLTPSVLANLPQPRLALGWKLVLAAQAGFVVGIALLLFSNLLTWFQPQEWPTLVISQFAGIKFPIPNSPFTIPHFPAFSLQPAGVVFLAIAAFLLWGVGNAVLLRGRMEVRK
jgi:anti-sigma factor RsiW